MARRIFSEVVIDAPAATVWAVLTDFAAHADWDPFLVSVQGEPTVGARLTVRFKQGMTFRPHVTEARPGQVLEWLGRLGIAGLFDGRHRFELREEDAGRTRLVHSETFTGLLVPFFGGSLDETERGFSAFNAAIKARAERAS